MNFIWLHTFNFVALKQLISIQNFGFHAKITGTVISVNFFDTVTTINNSGDLFNRASQGVQLFHLADSVVNQSDKESTAHLHNPPKRKNKPKSDQAYSQAPSISQNPYEAYQEPYNFVNTASPLPSPSNSGANTKNKTKTKKKTKKKPANNADSVKKLVTEADNAIVPVILIPIASPQSESGIDGGNAEPYDSNRSNANEPTNKSEYSSDRQPQLDQAAYINYLNAFASNQKNQYENQAFMAPYHAIPPVVAQQPFSNRIDFNQMSPSNFASAYGYEYSPLGNSPMLAQMPLYNGPLFADMSRNLERFGHIANSQDTAQRSTSSKIMSSINPISSQNKNMRSRWNHDEPMIVIFLRP